MHESVDELKKNQLKIHVCLEPQLSQLLSLHPSGITVNSGGDITGFSSFQCDNNI